MSASAPGGPETGAPRSRTGRTPVGLAVLAALLAGHCEASQPLPDVLRWLDGARSTLEATDSYTAVLHKRERVGGTLLPEEVILLKFKQPFKVYLRWVGERFNGRELLYVDGENDGRLKVREGGLLGVAALDLRPTGALAMRGNRHPITEAGLGSLVRELGTHLLAAFRAGHLSWSPHPPATVHERAARVVEWFIPVGDYYCPHAVTFIDEELSLPIRVLIFDAENRLVEEYSFEALTLDAGLTDADFDPANPAYRFKK